MHTLVLAHTQAQIWTDLKINLQTRVAPMGTPPIQAKPSKRQRIPTGTHRNLQMIALRWVALAALEIIPQRVAVTTLKSWRCILSGGHFHRWVRRLLKLFKQRFMRLRWPLRMAKLSKIANSIRSAEYCNSEIVMSLWWRWWKTVVSSKTCSNNGPWKCCTPILEAGD